MNRLITACLLLLLASGVSGQDVPFQEYDPPSTLVVPENLAMPDGSTRFRIDGGDFLERAIANARASAPGRFGAKEKAMFEVEGIDHVALLVRDPQASVRWYQEVLGLERRHAEAWGDVPSMVCAGTTWRSSRWRRTRRRWRRTPGCRTSPSG